MDRSDNDTEERQPGKYRFGFVLATTIGNMTRYLNLRKFAERDPEVELHWTPVTHITGPSAPRLLRALPQGLALRLWVLLQMLPALRHLGRLDAVMIHLFEAEVACVLRGHFFRRPVLVSSTDEAPAIDRGSYPLYPHQRAKPVWRRAFRLSLDRWRARRIDGFIPFTAWAGNILEQGCGVPSEKIFPIHVGLDLDLWTPSQTRHRPASGRAQILFVGTDFVRKGGELLLAVFAERFSERAELHLVTHEAPSPLPPHVHLHRDLRPNDRRLVELYAGADLLVLPTTADLTPWAFLEAMAMGCPAIGTRVGAIPEILEDGVTGLLVDKGDAAALGDAMQRILDDPDLGREMGRQGRARVERDFDAAINVPRILAVMKALVDTRRREPRAGAWAGRRSTKALDRQNIDGR